MMYNKINIKCFWFLEIVCFSVGTYRNAARTILSFTIKLLEVADTISFK